MPLWKPDRRLFSPVIGGGNLVGADDSGAGFDSSTEAWVSAVVTAGGTVSENLKGIVNTLIVSLKATGEWSMHDRLWFHGADDQYGALIDLKNLSTATNTGPCTFVAGAGFLGGSGKRLQLGYNPSTSAVQYTQNSASVYNYIYGVNGTDLGTDEIAMGSGDGTNATLYKAWWTSTLAQFMVNGGGTFPNPGTITTRAGMYVNRRTASNAIALDKNGSNLGTGTNASAALWSHEMYACGYNNNGTPLANSRDKIFVTGIAAGFTLTQSQNVSAYVNAAATSLGINVY